MTAESQPLASNTAHSLSRLGASFGNLFVGTGPGNSMLDANDEQPVTKEAKQQKHIETLEKARVDQDQTMAAILTEMVDHRAEAEKSKKRLELEVTELLRQNEHLKKCLKAMDADIEDRHALSEYAKMIQEQAPSVIDTPYVMRLKSQLAKALHKMGVLSNQLEEVKEENQRVVKDLHDQIVEAETAKNKAEVEFMNDLFVMERECNEMAEEYDAKLTSHQELIAQLNVELDLQREKKTDAVSFARHMKEEQRRSSSRSIDHMEAHAEGLETEMQEKAVAESRLRAELEARMKEVEDLRSRCNNQEKNMARLRVDLKTLNYEKSQYAPIVKNDAHADAKRKAKQVSARGA